MTRPPPVRCPHCHALLAGLPERRPAPPEVMVIVQRLTEKATVGARVLKILAEHFQTPVLTRSIVENVYSGPDGGPDYAMETVKIHIYRLRKELKPLGLTVIGNKVPQGGSTYRLDWLQRELDDALPG